jgi:hypothetical protein
MIRLSTSLVIVCLVAAVPAWADDDDCSVPMADWQPRSAVQDFAAGQGWSVTRIRLDDGCYELSGQDADGRWIEVKLDPSTLRVVEMEFENHTEGRSTGDNDD